MSDRLDVPPHAPVHEIDLTDAGTPEAVDERLARVERLLAADLASLGPSVLGVSMEDLVAPLEERLDRLDRRLDRLTRLVEAATAPLDEDEPPDPMLVRIEEAIVGLTIVVQQLGAAATEAARR